MSCPLNIPKVHGQMRSSGLQVAAEVNGAHRVAVVLEHDVARAVGIDEAGGIDGAARRVRADERALCTRGERPCNTPRKLGLKDSQSNTSNR